jgi:hypothetical protein
LKLAYSALVKGAGASETKGVSAAKYCVDQLVNKIRTMASSSEEHEQTLHRLHLTLISTLSSLPSALLPGVLDTIGSIISSLPGEPTSVAELIEALYTELLEQVGDREKGVAMRWWYDNRHRFSGVHAGLREHSAQL